MIDGHKRFMEHLNELVQTLPEPDNEYAGKTSSASSTPDNILFFHRRRLRAIDRFINIHHRHVLLCCLETAGTVIIDEHTIPLTPGNSILIFSLQLHHYILPQQPIIRSGRDWDIMFDRSVSTMASGCCSTQIRR